ncbi:alpha-1,3-rhamnosyl/mannosyltransferase [Ectothiorhodospira mobilis]|uniref:Alpha-1,3-rhamnosyl/mannosyltransferase n=1 Tax=Ectothiorhodospira mobilis TaxID=195064 RepID=A0A1I4SJ24_ECTMO|nr:glycosyltransferase family 1 protein [Ectothiorhodospira mobilis]SFM64320.1 alpha-1,3-rhamnosyl/mannosyltransferase [Ectothiorhodospira mobilis]
MNIILAVDALRPPLTGIGRYTLELIKGLEQHPDRPSMRYFARGRWFTDPLTPLHATQGGVAAPLRAALTRSRIVAGAYHHLAPHYYAWRLRGQEDALYHSPNFYMPPFRGRRVVTIHDLSTYLYPECHPPHRVRMMARELPRALEQADHIITVTEAVRRELILDHGVPPGRITAIHNGVDPGFHPRPPQALAPVMAAHGLRSGGYILCVATIEPRKNIRRLIQAHQALPTALRQAYPLVLVGGEGWNSQDIHQQIHAATTRGHVRYLRYVPEDHLPALYAGAFLMAYPSLYEGFGLPVLEAMASGTPVVASTCPSLMEVSNGAALHPDPLSVQALTQALQQGLEDAPWRRQAREKGLQRAATLTWDACVQRTLDLYRAQWALAQS